MRHISIAIIGAILLLSPPLVHAHDSEFSPGPMKSDQIESPAVTCKAVGSYQGHTRTWNYRMVGNGPDEREMPWLHSFCEHDGRQDVKGWFRYQEGLDIPDSAITVTVGR